MRVIHNFKNFHLKRVVDSVPSFLISNNNGSFFSLPLKSNPLSRFQGFHLAVPKVDSFDSFNFFKTIENISPSNIDPVTLVNNLWSYERHYKDGSSESFFMPKNHDVLFYESKSIKKVSLTLDSRPIYDFPEFNRNYEIFEMRGCIVIKYFHKSIGCEKLFEVFTVIAHNGVVYDSMNKWFKRDYSFDSSRNSVPSSLFVYHALDIFLNNHSLLSICSSLNLNHAISSALDGLNNFNSLKEKAIISLPDVPTNLIFNSIEHKVAYLCAVNSLNLLVVYDKGLFAGLPWFHQFWGRDEAISANGLSYVDLTLSKKFLFRQLNSLMVDGLISNIFFEEGNRSVDGVGWMFLYFSRISLSRKEVSLILPKLKQSIDILSSGMVDGLIVNGPRETWMDSDPLGVDPRDGARIEVQALFLSMVNFYNRLTNNSEKVYFNLEKDFKKSVIKHFWYHPILADGFVDGEMDITLRPNIFLAHYIFPSLFDSADWIVCFDYSLTFLLSRWDKCHYGICSIDTRSKLFHSSYSGEPAESYHRGDSWFFLNNLSAISLNRLNNKHFHKIIIFLLQSSVDDILWNGFIGNCSELSSAKDFSSGGSPVQAWSASTLIELFYELFRK